MSLCAFISYIVLSIAEFFSPFNNGYQYGKYMYDIANFHEEDILNTNFYHIMASTD